MSGDECLTCTECGYPLNECPNSKRPCGRHCNCSWIHDHCHWCDKEFGSDEDELLESLDFPTPEPEPVGAPT